MGAGPLKKGAMTPLWRKKGVPAKIIIPNVTSKFSSGIGLVNAVGLLAPSQRYSTIGGEEACQL
jgi:hypothetical protein